MLMGFDLQESKTVKRLEAMATSLTKVDLRLDSIKDSGAKAFKFVTDAASLRGVSRLGQGLNRLGDEVNSTVRLSSSLDSTFAASAKSGMQLAASARLTGKELRKFEKDTSVFYSLNVGAEEVQKTWLALNDAGLKVEDLGFKNLGEMTKFLQVAGMDGEAFVKQMEGLVNGFGFKPKEARQLADEILYIGRSAGVGAKFMSAMPEALASFNEEFRKVNPNVDAKTFMQYNRSMFLLAAAAEEAGASAEDAISQSRALFTTLSQSKVQFRDLMVGKGGGLPEQFKNELMALGDFNISDKPLEFIEILSKNYASFNDEQKQFASAWLTENMGADLDWLVKGNWDKVSARIKGVSESMGDAAGEANRMAKFYRDGLTDQDRYNRLNEQLEHSMTGLSRKMGVQGDLLKMQASANKAVISTMRTLVNLHDNGKTEVKLFGLRLRDANGEVTKSGEAAAFATKAFLGYKTAGIRGMTIAIVNSLSKHKKFQAMLGKDSKKIAGIAGEVMALAPQILTMIATLRLAGLGFGGLGPLILPAMVLGGGFLALEKGYKGGIKGFLKDASAWTQKELPKLIPKVKAGLSAAFSKAEEYVGPVKTLLMTLGKVLFAELSKIDFNAIAGKAGGIGKSVLGMIESVDWDAVGKSAANGLTWAFGKAFEAAEVAAPVLGNAAYKFIKAILSSAFDYMASDKSSGEKFEGIGKFLGGMLAAGIGLKLVGALTGSKLIKGVGGALLKPFAMVLGVLGKGGLAKSAGRLGKLSKFLGPIFAIGTFLFELPTIISSITDLVSKGTSATNEEILASGKRLAKSFLTILDNLFFGIPGMVGEYLGLTQGTLSNFYTFMVLKFEMGMLTIVNSGKNLWLSMKMIWTFIKMAAVFSFDLIRVAGLKAFALVSDAALGFAENVERGLRVIGGVGGTFLGNFVYDIKSKLLDAEDLFSRFKFVVVGVFASMAEGIEDGIISQLQLMRSLMMQMPAAIRSRIPGASEFLTMDLEKLRLTKKLNLDEKSRTKQEDDRQRDILKRRTDLEDSRARLLNSVNAMSSAPTTFSSERKRLKASLASEISSVEASSRKSFSGFINEGKGYAAEQSDNDAFLLKSSKANDAEFDKTFMANDLADSNSAKAASAKTPIPPVPKPVATKPKVTIEAPDLSSDELAKISSKGFNNITGGLASVADILKGGIKVILPPTSKRPSDDGI